MKVRRAVPGEGQIVAQQVRASLPPSFVPFTIWRSAKAGAWVETQLASPPDRTSSVYYLLIDQRGSPAGVAEFRSFDGDAFLNHFGVAPAYRGRGHAHLLLQFAMDDFLALHHAERVLLDVEASNTVAYDWYRRLGFAPCGETCWHLGEIQRQPARAGAILGLADAGAMHRRYGFSLLRIQTGQKVCEVGRLGRNYFRLDEHAWGDPGIHAALRQLDPKRRVLLVTSTPQPDQLLVRQTERLAVKTALLRRNLVSGQTSSATDLHTVVAPAQMPGILS